MKTDIISFILASGNRKKVTMTIFEYPKRQWSCSALEEITKIPHSTVFRTLEGLKEFGILKDFKINKKDFLYEMSENPLIEDLRKILDINKITSRKIAEKFVDKIKSSKICSIILYGSSVSGNIKPDSDIDVLIILNKNDKKFEQGLFNKSASYSSVVNKTVSLVIMDKLEIKKEKNSQFIKSVKENMKVIYGKKPF